MNCIVYVMLFLMNATMFAMKPAPIVNKIKYCNNCAYFLYPKSKGRSDNEVFQRHGKCVRFAKDMIDGNKDYQYAIDARMDESLCGERGRYFESHSFTTDCVIFE